MNVTCRAKLEDGTGWVYGAYVDKGSRGKFIIEVDDELYIRMHRVKPETFCISTGLYDRAGREAYSNDVIAGHVAEGMKTIETYTRLLNYRDGSFWIAPDPYLGNDLRSYLSADREKAKEEAICYIVGNIFDKN